MAKRGVSPKICRCGKPSLTGFCKGVALCQYHFNLKIYGSEWANKCANCGMDRPVKAGTGFAKEITK